MDNHNDFTIPELPAWLPLACDTETTGLYPDDGARLSVISIGWVDPDVVTDSDPEALRHAVKTGEGVHTRAYPYSQGNWIGPNPTSGEPQVKPDATVDLFTDPADNVNLGPDHYQQTMGLLHRSRLVFHNAKFDLAVLRHPPYGWDPQTPPGPSSEDLVDRTVWDTQVTAPEIWPGETSSLKPTAARLWGADSTAEQDALKPHLGPKTDPRYDLVAWDVIGPYAAKDAELTIRLYYQELAQLNLWWSDAGIDYVRLDQCRREIEVMKALYRLERAGIPYDANASLEMADRLAERRAALDAQLPFKPTGPEAKKFFFTNNKVTREDPVTGRPVSTTGLDLLPLAVTASGQPSFTSDIAERMIQHHSADTFAGRVLRVWTERNKIDNAISKWYQPYAQGIGDDGRLRTCFRQVTRGRGTEDGGTRSGRFSVERVNLQAIPHDYRLVAGAEKNWPVATPRQLIGRAAEQYDGWELWEFDLAQAELRVAAAWSGCDKMLDAITNGRDLHGETASELFHVKPGDSSWGLYRQIGKRSNFAQPYDEPVLTPDGWKTIGDLAVGSQVVGSDGLPQSVEDIPFDGLAEVWEVEVESGIFVRCSENHLWTVYDRSGVERLMTTAGLAEHTGTLTLPMTDPVQYPDRTLPVDPYILGVLLGDGSYRTTPYFTILTSDGEIADEVERRLPAGDRLVRTVYPSRPNMTRYSIHGGRVMQGLRELGLVVGYKQPGTGSNKFVPPIYLVSSVQQRLDLLRGLMDTDGCASAGGTGSRGKVGSVYKFVGSSENLVRSVVELSRSLGGIGSYRIDRSGYHYASIRGGLNPFFLARKAERWSPAKRRRLRVVSVRRTGDWVKQRCLKVSNPDELYITRDYVLTHNTLVFGAGGPTLGKMISKETGEQISDIEATKIVEDWNALYPQYRKAIDRWSVVAEREGAVQLASRDGFTTGRYRRFARDEDTHKAFNQLVQGSLAEFLKDWLLAVQALCHAEGLGLEPVPGVGYTGLLLTIHDSLVVLLPAGARGEGIAARIRQTAVDLWADYFGRPSLAVAAVPGDADGKRWGAEGG